MRIFFLGHKGCKGTVTEFCEKDEEKLKERRHGSR
jgi:hypothetical protein